MCVATRAVNVPRGAGEIASLICRGLSRFVNVEIRPIKQIKTAKYNPRRISDQQLASLKASIERFGFVDPVIVNDRTGTLVGGHQRIKAAKDLGLKDVPVVSVNLDDAEEKALNVALNKISGEWDLDLLRGVLEDVQAGGLDLSLTGFTEEEWSAMSGAPAGTAGLTDPDEVPELPEEAETITQPGDLWLLGEHRLLCGDSTKAEDVARVMGGVRADAVITDPPYGTGICAPNGIGNSSVGMALFGDEDASLARTAFTTWSALAPVQIWWGANYYSDALPGSSSWAVWDKDHHGMTFADAELAYISLGGPVRVFRHAWSGAHRASERATKREHPTQKPVALYVWLFETWGGNIRLIADPFLGSGTTLIAAEQLGRKCYGLEISPQYCDVIVRRWEQFTGKKASRAG